MRQIRYCGFLLALFWLTLAISLAATIAGYADRRRRWALRLVPLWARLLLAAGGVRVRVEGAVQFPRRGAIFVANHQSYLDILVLATVVPATTLWLAKRELFSIPVFGRAMRAVGQIPVDRGDREAARQSIARAARLVRDGANVILFPEGTRSRDGRMQPFKLGVVHLAADSGAPVVPLHVHGTGALWPRGAWGTHGGEVCVTVLPSQQVPAAVTAEEKRRVAKALRQRLVEAEGAPAC